MKAELSRRAVMRAGAAAGLIAGAGCTASPPFPGTLGGADFKRGHALRKPNFPAASLPPEKTGIVIAGGGIAGLAAGWRLLEAGFSDFILLELEDAPGGNARSGRNAISAYPLGAHYLPVPNREAKALQLMLRQFGMIMGERDGVPDYDAYQLCGDLEERLFWRGRWQEGLVPHTGLTKEEAAQFKRFFAQMADYSAATGADGRPAFASPMAYSSGDARFTALDGQSFAAWLDSQGLTAPPLRAHIRYCCRDDYGAEPAHVSAWAGVHYFAARRGWIGNAAPDSELTWPEGNGRLATLMADRLRGHIRTGRIVHQARQEGNAAVVNVMNASTSRTESYAAQAAILALPRFVAARLKGEQDGTRGFSSAPWVVATVSVSRPPRGKGAPLAWDNVSAGSESLGYVIATHQSSSAGHGATVLSWYMPLSTLPPSEARQLLLTRTLVEWQVLVRDDLLMMNPDLEGAITRIDIWRWGHAMIRPVPGFLSNPARLSAIAGTPPLFEAHSDLSGLSLFEEAHYRGVDAAERALRHLGHRFESLI